MATSCAGASRGRLVAAAACAVLLLAGFALAGVGAARADGNLAAGRPVTASPSCPASGRPAEPPAHAVDGRPATAWCAAPGSAAFLTVDLGGVTAVGRLVARHTGAAGPTVSVSTDGSRFSRLPPRPDTAPGTVEHRLAATPARYLRLDLVGQRPVRISEFEVYAAGGPMPAAVPTPSAVPCHSDAPSSLTDPFAGHGETMIRRECNADVAVYTDAGLRDLPAGRTAWVAPFVTDVWRHMKATYGGCPTPRMLPAPIGPGCADFGAPKPALALLHRGRHTGGTVATRFDAWAGHRTILDVGDPAWRSDDPVLRDAIVHEACHQVEGAGHGIHGSPAFRIWGDSKWAEPCIYDFYQRSGRAADAERARLLFTGHRDDVPAGAHGVAWFRDWFLPLWQECGADVAVRFFALLARHFPTRPENGGRHRAYRRDLTVGEFVHFSSAAAGRDLSARAAATFGPALTRAGLVDARRSFPRVDYP